MRISMWKRCIRVTESNKKYLIKLTEYAKKKNYTPQGIRHQLATGAIKGKKIKGCWYVFDKD